MASGSALTLSERQCFHLGDGSVIPLLPGLLRGAGRGCRPAQSGCCDRRSSPVLARGLLLPGRWALGLFLLKRTDVGLFWWPGVVPLGKRQRGRAVGWAGVFSCSHPAPTPPVTAAASRCSGTAPSGCSLPALHFCFSACQLSQQMPGPEISRQGHSLAWGLTSQGLGGSPPSPSHGGAFIQWQTLWSSLDMYCCVKAS